MILTKAQAKKGDGRVFATVFFDELGGELVLGSLSASAVLDLNEIRVRTDKGENLQRETLRVMIKDSLVDEQHAQFFSNDAEVDAFLLKVSGETLAEISTKIPESKNAKKKDVELGNEKASPVSLPTV